jgi:hypothetical protein
MRTDGWMDMTKLTGAFRDHKKAPKKSALEKRQWRSPTAGVNIIIVCKFSVVVYMWNVYAINSNQYTRPLLSTDRNTRTPEDFKEKHGLRLMHFIKLLNRMQGNTKLKTSRWLTGKWVADQTWCEGNICRFEPRCRHKFIYCIYLIGTNTQWKCAISLFTNMVQNSFFFKGSVSNCEWGKKIFIKDTYFARNSLTYGILFVSDRLLADTNSIRVWSSRDTYVWNVDSCTKCASVSLNNNICLHSRLDADTLNKKVNEQKNTINNSRTQYTTAEHNKQQQNTINSSITQ